MWNKRTQNNGGAKGRGFKGKFRTAPAVASISNKGSRKERTGGGVGIAACSIGKEKERTGQFYLRVHRDGIDIKKLVITIKQAGLKYLSLPGKVLYNKPNEVCRKENI